MASAADILKRADPKETPLKTVQLDAQVVLKVMQHCDNALPQLVTGQLLGLDVGHTLEITDCFPFPVGFVVCVCFSAACARAQRDAPPLALPPPPPSKRKRAPPPPASLIFLTFHTATPL